VGLLEMRDPNIIFLIENDKEYIYRLEQAFRRANIRNALKIARYGNEAILYLKGVGIYADRGTYPLPLVLMLDMTNPDGSSLAVLGWIREQPAFTELPILILANDEQERDVRKSFELGPNAHLLKRDNLDAVIRSILAVGVLGPSSQTANDEERAGSGKPNRL
jgi:CheY-like chemotaxis protein